MEGDINTLADEVSKLVAADEFYGKLRVVFKESLELLTVDYMGQGGVHLDPQPSAYSRLFLCYRGKGILKTLQQRLQPLKQSAPVVGEGNGPRRPVKDADTEALLQTCNGTAGNRLRQIQ